MKPNFALSLSIDGISLLQRSAAGWNNVGTVDPASPNLSEELDALRRVATALAPGGLRCKIVISNDHVRYLSIDTPDLDDESRREAARAALIGATPYQVEDLVFDVCADGDETHVAAVARETLEEAEIFATAHQLHAISFASHPEEGSPFAPEPFFGPTRAAADLSDHSDASEQRPLELSAPPDENSLRQETPQSATDTPDATDAPPTNGAQEINVDFEADAEDSTEESQPNFVSRRRVPTFRTSPGLTADFSGATDGSVPGFGEPAVPFEGPPKTKKPPTVVPAPTPIVRKLDNEAERFTIYGAPTTKSGSGRMGAMAVVVLGIVIIGGGVAAFASGATSTGLSALFARLTTPAPVAQFNAAPQTELPAPATEPEQEQVDPEPQIEQVSLEPALSDEDAAVLDALRDRVEIEEPRVLPQATEDELRAAYSVSGIWPLAPDVPSPSPLVDLEDLYVTSIDPINPNFDAVALPALELQQHDLGFLAPLSPAPAGTQFALDERGLVVPTPEGSLNPDGILVFAGQPPIQPPANMVKAVDPGEDIGERLRLAALRPKLRPSNLVETSERATLSGLTRSELGEIRPRLRPQSDQEIALASASLVPIDTANSRSLLENPETAGLDSASANGLGSSLRPTARPKDFDQTVAKALARSPAPEPTAAAVRVAPRAVTPKIPSSASASREATVKNALNLRQVNLIGVYGQPSSRRALVRLGSGRYQKVEVGDRIDGGRVSAIGDSELRYQKNGRAIVLKMPRS